jgi:molybdopterin-biosynthesis enzyme MoeA-like protein
MLEKIKNYQEYQLLESDKKLFKNYPDLFEKYNQEINEAYTKKDKRRDFTSVVLYNIMISVLLSIGVVSSFFIVGPGALYAIIAIFAKVIHVYLMAKKIKSKVIAHGVKEAQIQQLLQEEKDPEKKLLLNRQLEALDRKGIRLKYEAEIVKKKTEKIREEVEKAKKKAKSREEEHDEDIEDDLDDIREKAEKQKEQIQKDIEELRKLKEKQ